MIELHGITWIPYHGALVPDMAPHIEIDLSDQDIRFLLKNSGAYFLRWNSRFDQTGESAFWHVIKNRPSDLAELSKNTRNQVRKGLKNCRTERIDPTQLARTGYEVYRKAMESYQTDLPVWGPDDFLRHLEKISRDTNVEFWGTWDHMDRLIGYSQNKIQNDTCNYQVIKHDPEFLGLYGGYALIFSMNEHYLNERKMLYVNDGARQIRHETGVQEFLVKKFKFRKAFSTLHVVYAPRIGMAVRLFFPFRSALEWLPGAPARKLKAVLSQEEIRRSCIAPNP